jgi:GTP-binding protein YchF
MGLKCGIIGLTNSGKTTLFNCISNTRAEITDFAFGSTRSNMGMVAVPDPRLNILEKLQETQKVSPTTVEIVDIPGLTKGSSRGEGVGNAFLADIRNTDALLHVVRCFDDENLPHIEGSIDPVRDKEIVDFELQLRDLGSIEKKIEKLSKQAKGGDKEALKGLDVLRQYKNHLENFQPIRSATVPEADRHFIEDLFLLTDKPVLYICNVDEQSAITGNHYVDAFREAILEEKADLLVVAAGLEAEIAELEEVDDRVAFLKDLGLDEPGVNKLIRAAYALLDLITFFTMGPREIRAWTLQKGKTVPEAAGVIHSDMERGFIRAEVMHFEDLSRLGSEQACKEKGKLHVEGKNYVVQDGDILHIRFNV